MTAAAEDAGRRQTDWITIAKGIGIILVVVGHFEPAVSPRYWLQMRSIIYTFHMPLFFLLSGYLYDQQKYTHATLVRNKVRRLMYPFLTMAVGFGLIKLAAARFVTLDNPVDWDSVAAVLVDPANSYAPPLWFLQALFLMFCLYPLLRRRLGDGAIVVLFVLLNEAFGSKYPVVGRMVANMPFFAFGCVLRGVPALSGPLTGGRPAALAATVLVFAAGCAIDLRVNIFAPHAYVIQFALGLVGSLLVINVSQAVAAAPGLGWRAWLVRIGYHSMTIYFFHSLFESAVRIGLLQALRGVPMPFLLVAALSVSAGIAVPILIEQGIIRKCRLCRRYMLGLE